MYNITRKLSLNNLNNNYDQCWVSSGRNLFLPDIRNKLNSGRNGFLIEDTRPKHIGRELGTENFLSTKIVVSGMFEVYKNRNKLQFANFFVFPSHLVCKWACCRLHVLLFTKTGEFAECSVAPVR